MKIPKILFVAEWYPANFQRWLAEGFNQAGCEIKLAGSLVTNHYGFEWPKEDLPELFFRVPKDEPIDLKKVVDKSTSLGFSPDVLIFHDWWDSPVEKTEDRIPLVLIEHEGWNRHFKRMDEFKPTSAYTGQPYGVFDQPRKDIYPGFEWLPGAADPFIHTFLNIKRDLDFVFFGALSYDNRLKLCKTVKADGFEIDFGQVSTKEYTNRYNRGLCTMECSGGQQYIKWRIFEAMSMQCLVISDSFTLLDSIFEPGVHYIPCRWIEQEDGRHALDPNDLIKNIFKVKSNPDIRDVIVEKAFNLVREKHTYFHRAKKILNALNIEEPMWIKRG